MVPPPKGKDFSRMTAPPAVVTTTSELPSSAALVESPATAIPTATGTLAATTTTTTSASLSSSSSSSSSPSGGSTTVGPSPRTDKPKGKDFSRMMMGSPPSSSPLSKTTTTTITTTTASSEVSLPLSLPDPATASVLSPPSLSQSQPLTADLNIMGIDHPSTDQDIDAMVVDTSIAANNDTPAVETSSNGQPSPLITQAQSAQYFEPLAAGASMNNITQEEDHLPNHFQQPQESAMQSQQQQQQPQQPSTDSSSMNDALLPEPLAVASSLPSQRPSWFEAQLSNMLKEGVININGSNISNSVKGIGSSITDATATATATATNTVPSSSSSRKDNTDIHNPITQSNVEKYGKSSLAPMIGEKLQNLCHSIDPSYTLDSEVQERLAEMADTFVNKVTKDAIKLARHRGSTCMDVVDVALALKKGYNMDVPGLGPPSKRMGSTTSGWMFAEKISLGGSGSNNSKVRKLGGGDAASSKKKRTG